MKNNLAYENKFVVLGGDFRQGLSVVKHGNRVIVVETFKRNCQTWWHFHQLKLHQNMRAVAGS